MKAKKILALSLAATMTFAMTGCGGSKETAATTEPAAETETTQDAAEETQEDAAQEQESAGAGEASIDFEDGVFGFAGIDKTVNSAGDDSVLSVEDYNGSKALKVSRQAAKAAFVGFQADALLGASLGDVATIEMSIGTENPDGKFGACSGNIYAFVGEDNTKTNNAWSVYLEDDNPKMATIELSDKLVEGNYIVVSLETDTAADKGAAPANFYIDNIAFKDASGNVLSVDTSAEYVSADTGVDRSNLCALKDAVEFEGFAVSGDGWAQAGVAMTDEIKAALVPGSVVEISYTSETGDMWVVMNEAEAGWMRVGQGNADGSGSDSAAFDGKTAQITYEQIAALCGDDVSKWGSTMQCESSGAWEVYSVAVGTAAE